MGMEHDHLEQAERHIVAGERVVTQQRRLLASLPEGSKAAALARDMLANFEATLAAHYEHRAVILKRISEGYD